MKPYTFERTLYYAIILAFSVLDIKGCLGPPGVKPMPGEEKLFKSDIVLTGKDVKHIPLVNWPDGTQTEQANMTFKVYCVLKDDGQEINEHITVRHLLPDNSCDGTSVQEGKEYILMLQRYAPDVFTWHLVTAPDSAVYDLTNEKVAWAVTVCGLQNVTLPSNNTGSLEDMCPKPDLTRPCLETASNTTESLEDTTESLEDTTESLDDMCPKPGLTKPCNDTASKSVTLITCTLLYILGLMAGYLL